MQPSSSGPGWGGSPRMAVLTLIAVVALVIVAFMLGDDPLLLPLVVIRLRANGDDPGDGEIEISLGER